MKVRKTVAAGKAPKWCENNSKACTAGAKQMVYFNQKDGNNIVLTGNQADGQQKSPGYNMKMGFKNGSCTLPIRTLSSVQAIVTDT